MGSALPGSEVGGDESSWSYDGYYEEKMHAGISDTYGKVWQVGDVVGVFLDLTDHTISKYTTAS